MTKLKITFDAAKRAKTFADRGLNFEDAPKILQGLHFVQVDDRKPIRRSDFLHMDFVRQAYYVRVDANRGRNARLLNEKVQ